MKKTFIMSTLTLMLFLTPTFSSGNTKTSPSSSKENLAVVHIYRPNKIIGFGWVFNLRINEEKITKIKNGVHLVLNLEPGQTCFKVKGKTIKINLESGKVYYLRSFIVRNMLLGKPDLVEVTESTAKQELDIKSVALR